MADRLIKRLAKAIVNKGTVGSYPLNTTNTSFFNPFKDFMNYLLGRQTLDKYIKAYGRNPFVSMIINKIAFQSASIKRIAEDKNEKPLKSSKILDLLANPNPDQNQIEFLEEATQYYSSAGNCFIHHIKGIGAGDELKVLQADKVEIICNKISQVISYKWTRPDGMVQTIDAEEVLHIHESNIVHTDKTEAKYGLSKLHAAMIVVVSSDEKFKSDASIAKNKGASGLVTTDSDNPMLPAERDRMQEEFDNDKMGSDKFGKIMVSTSKLRYLQMGMSPTDLKILDGLLSSLRTLCATYGLSSVIFNDTANSTYNNVVEAFKFAYIDVYIPTANKFDDKLSKFLSERLGVEEVIKVDLTSIEVIKASTNEVLQALNSMPDRLSVIAIQSLTDDEIREMITIAPLTANQTTVGQAAQTPSNDGETN